MARLLTPRVQAFVEYVGETEEAEVFQQFSALFKACDDPNEANLFVLLDQARRSGAGAEERAMRQRAARNLAHHHCNS